MSDTGEPLLQIRDVVQDYGGLRPLRVKAFELRAGQRVAILGMDQGAAEVFVNLVTGAAAPRAGEVRAFGRLTTDIPDSDTWLDALRAYGLLGVRTVLIDQLTVAQNLALPLTLDVDPMPDALKTQVRQRALELGLSDAMLDRHPTALTPLDLQRVRLGRALALEPGCCSPNIRRRRSNAPMPTRSLGICRALLRIAEWPPCTSPPTARLRSRPLTKLSC